MKKPGIKYKDTLAMPGSELHHHLEAGDLKAAEKSYQEAEVRHRKLLGLEEKPKTKEAGNGKHVT